MARELSMEDRQAIGRTLALTGHIFDRGELNRLEEIFTPKVVYDLSDVGAGTFEGVEAIRNGALKLGAGNPIAHHVTNIVITGQEDDLVTAQSKGLIIMADGSVASVTHLDTLRSEDSTWRISRRVILAQRTPLGGLHLTHTGER
ncbi:nuclear transport factor 2 family protein [Nonomuraea guangzhouensis]|uniref:Nuclear transport factor 2 family protein n=1 Tax=Nonomuraea guangzhouensis TaxID=1291555 RepID=A0ABW4GUJ8_9ACTN|nr:nuclear transport factor 2 family protein [Nonomuraea guangzhouensis]